MLESKKMCEFVLVKYPAMLREQKIYERYLMEICLSGGGCDAQRVIGGSKIPQEERYVQLKEENEKLGQYQKFTGLVESALSELSSDYREIIQLKYFSDPAGKLSSDRIACDRDVTHQAVERWVNLALGQMERKLVSAWFIWKESLS